MQVPNLNSNSMKLRNAIPAGIADTASASLATFIVGVFAVTTLEAELLGVYAIFFAAFIVADLAPGLLLLQPIEVHAVSRPVNERLAVIGTSLRLAALSPMAAVLVAAGVVAVTIPLATTSEIVAIAATFIAAAALAPAQEHIRRMLHIANRSWQAAMVSSVQVPTVVASIGVFLVLDVPTPWIPFGTLAFGHAAALAVGYGCVKGEVSRDTMDALSLGALVRTGRWLLAGGLAPAIGGVVAGMLVGRISGPLAVGYAEAARIAGRPLLVLTTGLMAVIGPRAMAAGARRDSPSTSRQDAALAVMLLTFAILYGAALLFGPISEALAGWMPLAYEITGLIALVLFANLVLALGWTWRFELIGRGKEAQVALTDLVAALTLVAVAFTARALEAYTIPMALAAFSLVALGGYRRLLQSERISETAVGRVGT